MRTVLRVVIIGFTLLMIGLAAHMYYLKKEKVKMVQEERLKKQQQK